MTEPTPMTSVLIFGGKTGWIGQLMAELIDKEGTTTTTEFKLFHHNDDE